MTPNAKALRVAQVLWPSFLMAGVLEMLVFSVIDPGTVSLGSWQPAPDTVYSVAFLAFWAIISMAVSASLWMSAAPQAQFGAKSTKSRQRRVRQPVAQHQHA